MVTTGDRMHQRGECFFYFRHKQKALQQVFGNSFREFLREFQNGVENIDT